MNIRLINMNITLNFKSIDYLIEDQRRPEVTRTQLISSTFCLSAQPAAFRF